MAGYRILVLSMLLAPFIALAGNDKVIRLEGISIQGAQEQPGVMTITPWREAPGTGRLQAPVKRYQQHWLQPLSAERLRQEMQQAGQALKPAAPASQ